MIVGVDTNVLLRFIVRDDPRQARAAVAFFREQKRRAALVFINHVVLSEFVWVLARRYRFGKRELVRVIEQLLETKGLAFENDLVVTAAFETFRDSKADFADCLISEINAVGGCEKTYSFDRAVSLLPRCAVLSVS